jgi:hypothetical protein
MLESVDEKRPFERTDQKETEGDLRNRGLVICTGFNWLRIEFSGGIVRYWL